MEVHSAVDVDAGSGDVIAPLAREKSRRQPHIARLAQPERNGRGELRHPLIAVGLKEQFGFNDARIALAVMWYGAPVRAIVRVKERIAPFVAA